MEERGRRLWRTREGPVVCLQREKRKRENEARNVAFPTRGTSIGWCSSISRFVVPDISFPYGSLNTRREGDGVDFVDVCFRQKSLHDMMSSWRRKKGRERFVFILWWFAHENMDTDRDILKDFLFHYAKYFVYFIFDSPCIRVIFCII